MTVGCDNITTIDNSTAFVTGDTLTLLGRTFVGSFLFDAGVQVRLMLSPIVYTWVCIHSSTQFVPTCVRYPKLLSVYTTFS